MSKNFCLEKRFRIRRIVQLKETIERENQEILPEYREGKSRRDISIQYKLTDKYGIELETAKHIISLIVYDNIPRPERLEIAREHEQEGSRKTKRYQEKNHCGINAKSDEKGLNSARKKGLHALGLKIWTTKQERCLVELASNSLYQWQAGRPVGEPNYGLITQEFNRRFGTHRTSDAVSEKYFKLKNPDKNYKHGK